MTKSVFCFLAGVVATVVFLFFVRGYTPSYQAKELVDAAQKIELGMPTSDVERMLGSGYLIHKLGGGFPNWATNCVPNDYWKTHGLISCGIGSFEPYVLLVYFDENGLVSFVSNTDS